MFEGRFDQKYRENPGVFGAAPSPVIEKAVAYIPAGNALDLGVGNGRNALYLLSKSFTVTGVDVSEEGIRVLKKKLPGDARIRLVVSDVLDFDTQDTYDLVSSIGLLHFLKPEDGEKLIHNMQGLTKAGGVNVIGAKMTQNFRGDLPHVFAHDELKAYYTKAGWTILDYEENRRGITKVATLIAQKPGERLEEGR